MNRKIYRQIAKKYGVSVTEVKREMQAAIYETYQSPNAAALAVPRKGAVPTVDEFVDYAAGRVRGECDAGGDCRSTGERESGGQ